MHTIRVHNVRSTLLIAAVFAMVASACEFAPADFAGTPAFAECFGKPATVGIGWHGAIDPPGGSTYEGTQGDDVVVIINGPVTFNGLGGNDLICVNDTSMTAGEGPITINSGAGDDQVMDRRLTHTPQLPLNVSLADGDDRFYGAQHPDEVQAGPGDDEVNGGGGIDDIDCGPGADLHWTGAFLDPASSVAGCERTDEGLGPVDEPAIQARLDEMLAESTAPGTQIGIRVPGQPDMFVAAGVDDVLADPQTPMPTDGTFPVASITKTFTSAVILQLIEEGQLSFDDTLDQWAPTHPNADGITIRMLLNHTSGIDLYSDAIPAGTMLQDIYANGATYHWTPTELVLDKSAGLEPFAAPGSTWKYSNSNYWVLSYIIEQIADRTIAEVLDQRIFQPYGLTDSTLDDGTATITQHGWFHFGSSLVDLLRFPRTAMITWASGAGNGVSSLPDLLDWAEILYAGEFLGDAMDAELHALTERRGGESVFSAPDPNGDYYYGLGVVGWCPCDGSTTSPTPSRFGHTGGIPGSATRFFHDSEAGTSFVIRSNSHDLSLESESAFIEDLYVLLGTT